MLIVSPSNTSRLNNSQGNIVYMPEENFSIIQEDIRIWTGELPFKQGDKFPSEDIVERAAKYKTYKELYNTNYNDTLGDLYNYKSYEQDPFGYTQIYDLDVSLPDFKGCTEAWVNLIAANPPRIDGEKEEIDKLSSLLSDSNFSEQFKSIVRGALIMYGNKVFRINKLSGGLVKIIDMRLTNWIPFVNEEDTTTIEVNTFYNIVDSRDKGSICEFISYFEDGNILKETYKYNDSSKTLGEKIGEDKSLALGGVSPIVVFTGNAIDSNILGSSSYIGWNSAIVSSIRAYGNMMTMLERAKEAILVAPSYAGETDEMSDQRILRRRGAIEYTTGQDHDVMYVTAQLNLEQAIDVYKQTLARLSRDTDLAVAFFDSREVGARISADALRASMFKTELESSSRINEITRQTKQLIVKFALANGLDIKMSDFNLIVDTGFIKDKESEMKIIQARSGNAITMSQADAIAAYDNVPNRRAQAKADELNGITPKENDSLPDTLTDSGDSDGISFSVPENNINQQVTQVTGGKILIE